MEVRKLNFEDVTIRPWQESDLSLLKSMNSEKMWEHLGGPEADEKVLKRHQRFLEFELGRTCMYAIMVEGKPGGSIGNWEKTWENRDVFEVGWMVLPEFQGKGVATMAAKRLLDTLRSELPGAEVHAFPSAHHPASNAICEKSGFTLKGITDFEFPKGSWMKCHDWCIYL